MILALVTSAETAPPLATALATVGECACDGRRLRLRRSSTAQTTVGMRKWKSGKVQEREGGGIRDVSNERAETRLIEKSYADEEIAAIAQKHKMPRYPKIALLREKLSRKAKEESQFRFYCRKSQRGYVLKYAPNFYSELQVSPPEVSAREPCAYFWRRQITFSVGGCLDIYTTIMVDYLPLL